MDFLHVIIVQRKIEYVDVFMQTMFFRTFWYDDRSILILEFEAKKKIKDKK